MAVVLAYGDSNTHGTAPLTALGEFRRHPPGARWPDVLAEQLPDHAVLSEGLPGRTTVHDDPVEGGARNGLAVLPAILGSHAPLDAVLVMLGTNDLKHRFSVTAWEIARSVERLVTVIRAEAPDARIMMIAPAPVRPAGVLRPVFMGAEARQEGLANALADAAARQGVAFFDAAGQVAVSPVDGVHWEPAAHRRFGAALAPAVAQLIAEAG